MTAQRNTHEEDLEQRPSSIPHDSSSMEEDAPSGVHRHLGCNESVSVSRIRRPWEVVEEFEHDGFNYRLQRRPIDHDQSTRLARREQEALELASGGLSRKQIAAALGVAPSTVGVLLHRASLKLGTSSRSELIQTYRDSRALQQKKSQSED